MNDWLNEIEVASPCHEDWAAMRGDERARHCASCRQDVYDLSGLSRAEALSLVRRAQGGEEVCVRFRRRADGTVLTADCPSQVRRARVLRKGLRGVAASAAALLGGALAQGCEPGPSAPPPFTQVMGKMMAPVPSPGDPAASSGGESPDPAVGSGEACCADGLGACCLPQASGEGQGPALSTADAPREPELPCEGAQPPALAGEAAPAPRAERRLPRAGE